MGANKAWEAAGPRGCGRRQVADGRVERAGMVARRAEQAAGRVRAGWPAVARRAERVADPMQPARRLAVGAVAGVLCLAYLAGGGRAAAGAAGGLSGGALAVRMAEAMAWPERFTAVVEVTRATEPPRDGVAKGSAAAAPAIRLDLTGFPPDLFGWQPQQGVQGVAAGVAWAGLVELRREGPGPRFAYSYADLPFLEALRVYFAVFRPLPEGSRLTLSGLLTFAGRQAVEASLREGADRQAVLVVDVATGLILKAATLTPERRTLLQALPPRQPGGPLQRIEYEVPVLGPSGRMTLERVGGRWFITEAVAGDPPHRVRFTRIRLGPEAAGAQRPDPSRLERIARLRQQGEALVGNGRWGQAVEVYQELAAMDPYSAEAYNRLGYAAMRAGDWLLAASAFDQVIHLNPRSPVGYNNLAYLYAQHEVNLSQALRLAEKALELMGDRPDATVLDTYGWVLVKNGRPQEAVGVLERALGLSGQDPRAQAEILYHLGLAHMQLNRHDVARKLLRQALELQPELGEARQALGQLTQEGGPSAP